MLAWGEAAPMFTARSSVNEKFHFSTAAGRYVVLCFFGSASNGRSQQIWADVEKHSERFDVENVMFFGVTTNPADQPVLESRPKSPGVIHFWDFDSAISRLFEVAGEGPLYRPTTVVLDQSLRILTISPWPENVAEHIPNVLRFIERQQPLTSPAFVAPVLIVPNVFEREFCQSLIQLYERHGGTESGFMRDINGKTVAVTDPNHKRRSDYEITDDTLIRQTQIRMRNRLLPEIKKAFQFDVTRIERHIVACYDAASGGHFRAHRDNTTLGTAHRRFAVTINLNAEEFEGGNLRFPEFGRRAYRAPTGGAVVFSCSLLHEATPVTRGKRYAFLPFLYDEAAAKIRQANLQYVSLDDQK